MKRVLILTALLLTACANPSSQSNYSFSDIGRASNTVEGTILKSRLVAITGENRGNGMLAGGALGAVGASNVGNGTGNGLAVVGAAIVGAIVGNVVEQGLADSQGVEYTVRTGKKIITIVQNQAKDDTVFKKGDKVLVQSGNGYQRVLEF